MNNKGKVLTIVIVFSIIVVISSITYIVMRDINKKRIEERQSVKYEVDNSLIRDYVFPIKDYGNGVINDFYSNFLFSNFDTDNNNVDELYLGMLFDCYYDDIISNRVMENVTEILASYYINEPNNGYYDYISKTFNNVYVINNSTINFYIKKLFGSDFAYNIDGDSNLVHKGNYYSLNYFKEKNVFILEYERKVLDEYDDYIGVKYEIYNTFVTGDTVEVSFHTLFYKVEYKRNKYIITFYKDKEDLSNDINIKVSLDDLKNTHYLTYLNSEYDNDLSKVYENSKNEYKLGSYTFVFRRQSDNLYYIDLGYVD